MDLCRYIALYDPQWRKPKRRSETTIGMRKAMARKRKQNKRNTAIVLGPGT
jgi:hypothetical protein